MDARPSYYSIPAFEYYVRDQYKEDTLKDRDLQTMYFLCSGHFKTLEKKMDGINWLSKFAQKPIDYYLRTGPFDEETIVEMGKSFLGDIQFDKIKVNKRCGEKFDMTANTFILANPTKHGEGEAPKLMGMSDHSAINFPTVFSPKNQYYYVLSPSERVFEEAKRNPIVFENLELPQYLYQHSHLFKNKRWHLNKDYHKGRIKRITVRNKLLFNVATKILYAMVETVADNLDAIKERSWHISGLYGTGKSTSLMICQSLWCQRPSRYRVVYLPYADLFESAHSFRRLVCHAFFRDPIQHLLLAIGPENVEEMFTLLENFLTYSNLFFVIVIDHLEEVWDGKKSGVEKAAKKFIKRELWDRLQQGLFKRILLITGSDPNSSAARIKSHRNGQLNLELLDGFNEFEARWMVERFLTKQPADTAEHILEKAKSFGVRPFENNFAVLADYLVVGCSMVNPLVNEEEVKDRIKELKKGIVERFDKFVNEPSEYLKARKFDKLLDVFYAKLINKTKLDDDSLYDKRYVKRVICPVSWDALGSRVNMSKVAVGALPLPINDVHDYELMLCDPDFRKAFGEGTLQYCWLPCNEITRQTLHTKYMSSLHWEAGQKLKHSAPGSEPLLFKDAWEQDISVTGMKTIYARSVSYYSNRRSHGFTISPLRALLNFAVIKTEYGEGLACAYGEHRHLNQRARLTAIGLEPEYLYLFRMSLDFEFDFCLVQNENCFAVQTVYFKDKHLLKRRMLEAAYVLGTRRAELLPVLYGKAEKAKLLFVCRPNPFGDQSEETKNLKYLQIAPKDEEKGIRSSPYYKSWSMHRLAAKVGELLSKGYLEVELCGDQD